jgi:hypothetical protein
MLSFRVFWRRLSVQQRHAQQQLHHLAGLDGCVTVVGLSAAFAARRCFPSHGGIEPDC